MRTRPLAGAALLCVAALGAPRAGAQESRPVPGGGTLYVTAGEVHTGGGEVFRPGAVAIRAGRVTAVGAPEAVPVPAGAERLDAGPGAVVIPGLVAAWSEHLSASGRHPESVSEDVRALDAYDFRADETRLLAGGVTTVLVSPGSSQVVSGRAAVVKVAGGGREARTLRADAGLVIGIGDAVQQPPALLEPPTQPDAATDPLLPHRRQLPVTRAGALLVLRNLLAGRAAGAAGPLFVGARSAADIEAAVGFLEETGTQGVLVGCLEAHAVVPLLAERGQGVVLLWPGRPGRRNATDDPRAEAVRLRAGENPALLAAAGVPFALSVEQEAALPDLLFAMASACRHGLDPHAGLASITSAPAALLGVGDRVGLLAPGLDGDLVVLSGAPHDLRATPLATVANGMVAWRRLPRAGEHGVTVVVRAAEVHLGDGRVLVPGEVAFEDGKVVEVGRTVGAPPGARLIDLGDGAVVPGFIDAYSHAGLAGAGGEARLDLATSLTASAAVDPADPAFGLLARRGVTSILAVPSGTGRVAGRASVVKTAGEWPGRRVVREDAGLIARLAGDADVAAAAEQIASALKKAKDYRAAFEKYEKALKEYEAWKKKVAEEKKKAEEEAQKKAEEEAKKKKAEPPASGEAPEAGEGKKPPEEKEKPAKKEEEKEEPKKPSEDEALEGWASLLDKKVPLFVRAETVVEIRAALKLVAEKEKLRLVIVGGSGARRVWARLEKSGTGVVAGPTVMDGDRTGEVNLLRELALSDVTGAVGSGSYLGGSELDDVLAYAVARGLSPASAVRLATGGAARLLGVADRIGSIERGKDADLLLLSAPPFAAGSRLLHVFVNGEEVPLED